MANLKSDWNTGDQFSATAQNDVATKVNDGVVPPGSVMSYAGSTAPTGWLLCYGQSLDRTTYANLFAAISTTYGSVDGTHFNVPDLRGRVAAGRDDMGGSAASRLTNQTNGVAGTLAAVGGEQTHTLSTPEIPAHSHQVTAYEWTTTATVGSGSALVYTRNSNGNNGVQNVVPGGSTSAGGGGAHNVIQPTIVLNSIIKT